MLNTFVVQKIVLKEEEDLKERRGFIGFWN